MTNDWSGNSKSIYSTLGASSHSDEEREENDFYATDPKAVDILLNESPITFEKSVKIWEPCCGLGHISNRLIEKGFQVENSDLIDRDGKTLKLDFLQVNPENYIYDRNVNIITNPPYKFAKEFVEKSLELVNDGRLVAMFLKLQFMEGKARKKMFLKYPPRYVLVSSSRLLCGKNGDFSSKDGSAVAYAWYIWEKGFQGHTEIRWVN